MHNLRRSISPVKRALNNGTEMREITTFLVHPEKMKQIMKERNAQKVCRLLESDAYKQKVREIVENQADHILNPKGLEMKYQHVINCAQPMIQKEEDVVVEELVPMPPPKRKIGKRMSITSVMLKKKQEQKLEEEEDEIPKLCRMKVNKKKKIRKRTTILPIFFMKMYGKKPNSGIKQTVPKKERVQQQPQRQKQQEQISLEPDDNSSLETAKPKLSGKVKPRQKANLKPKFRPKPTDNEHNLKIDESFQRVLDVKQVEQKKISTGELFQQNLIIPDSYTLFMRVKKDNSFKSLPQVSQDKYQKKVSKTLENARQKSSLTYITVDNLNKKKKLNSFKFGNHDYSKK